MNAMQLHSKAKGSIGQLSVAQDLINRGYSVFTELGDNSKVDLVAIKESQTIRIQVKYITPKNGSVNLYTRKTGPNYFFRYTAEQVDVFAVHVPGFDKILYVSSKELLSKKTQLSIRISNSKNKQNKGIHPWQNYTQFNF